MSCSHNPHKSTKGKTNAMICVSTPRLFAASLRKTQLQRDVEMRTQLTNRDREGMTAAMLAAKSASLAVLEEVLREVDRTEVIFCL